MAYSEMQFFPFAVWVSTQLVLERQSLTEIIYGLLVVLVACVYCNRRRCVLLGVLMNRLQYVKFLGLLLLFLWRLEQFR
jgi:hypothetical protein